MKRPVTVFGSVLVVVLIATFAITAESKSDEVQQEVQQDFANPNVQDLIDLGVDPNVMALDCNLDPENLGCGAFFDCREEACGPACTCVQCFLYATAKCNLWYRTCENWGGIELLNCYNGRDICQCADGYCFCP